MFSWLRMLASRRDTLCLLVTLCLLILAIINPKIPLKRDVHHYLLVVDISQSMNTVDQRVSGKPASRLAYVQNLLHGIVGELPCDTKVSIAVFAGANIATLYTPIEVCNNFHAINDTIAHLDWRMAWSGNSRMRSSLESISKTLRSLPNPAQVIFFTDGEEAPRLHVFNRANLSTLQGVRDWLLVGIGGFQGTPIPKYDAHNQLIGYWANSSFAMQPGIAQISESNLGIRDEKVASGASDRYLSRLDEGYLKALAQEINGHYVRGYSVENVISAMYKQQPAYYGTTDFPLRALLAGLALCVFLASYALPNRKRHGLNAKI